MPLQILVQLVDSAVEGGGDGLGLEVLVAVHPGDLLHDVGLDGHIAGGAPGGYHHVHIVAAEGELEAQRRQLGGDILRRQGLAQTALQPADRHVDLRLLQRHGIVVGKAGDLHIGIQLMEQLHGQVEGLVAALGVDGLLVPGGGLGAVVVPQGGAADAGGLEVGHLQNDLVRLGQDGVLGAAHDACQTHHACVVGDGQIVGSEGQLLAVEQQQLLALLGAAHDNVTGNVVRVEGVGGLTGGQHHIVGDVHQRVDGPHTHAPDAALHLVGGGLDAEPLDLSGQVARAALRVLHGDVEPGGVLHVPVEAGELHHGQMVQRRQLPGDAVVPPQVGAVGHGLVVDFQDDIVEIQRVGQRCAGGRIEGAEVEDDGLPVGGEQVGKADLHGAADHAVAVHAPELALLDLHRLALAVPAAEGAGQRHRHLHAVAEVGAAADDLLDVAAADVGAADTQLIRVGVRQDLLDLTHHHIVERSAQIDGVLHLHGGHGQVIGQTLQIHILRQLYIVPDPIQ